MSRPFTVFLDTSVYASQQYNFGSAAFEGFKEACKVRALKVLLPETTRQEIERQIRQRSQEALSALEEARRKAPFLRKWRHFPKLTVPQFDEWEVKREATQEWNAFRKSLDVEKLGYEYVDLSEVMYWYDRVIAPFREGKKRKEFPDAFAISALAKYAAKTGESIAVVSEDQDFRLACDRFQELLYFKSLSSVVEYFLLSDEQLDGLRAAVVDSLGALEDSVLQSIEKLPVIPSHFRYSVDRSKYQSIEFSGVNIVALGHDECTLVFDVELEAEHLYEWDEEDEDKGGELHQERWVLDRSRFACSAKVELNPESHAISGVKSVSIDPEYLEARSDPAERW